MRILTGFDGACPQSDEAVSQLAPDRYEVRPSWRGTAETLSEERPGEGFSFCVKVAVEGAAPREGELRVNWEDEGGTHMRLRDCVFAQLPGESDWRMVPAPVEGGTATVRMAFPPGETVLALCPLYNVAQAETYLAEKAAHALAALDEIGKSGEGRPVRRLRVASERYGGGKKRAIVMARTHPYESAGSYASEGAIDFLLSGSDLAGYLLSRWEFHFLPMMNPDGVARGLSRLTAPAGHNLNRVHDGKPPENLALRALLDETRPDALVDLHNWMDKRKDGMLVTRLSTSRHLARIWPPSDGKYWLVRNPQDLLDRYGTDAVPEEHYTWCHYGSDRFGTDATTFEFPWFARTVRRMRAIGAEMLRAYLIR